MESKLRTLRAGRSLRNKLLIEPVWNRNPSFASKQRSAPSFNRTSMESKHARNPSRRERQLTLLIEPVWNRNLQDTQSGCPFECLLIEPVWNRNGRSPMSAEYFPPFNRTSMESKRVHCDDLPFLDVLKLLIEPVWNRNANFRTCVQHPCECSF